MVKLRNAFYCNLKLTLIFLVIFGHWIEPELGTDPRSYQIYRLIYLVHMPLFAFLSGLFIRSSTDALRQVKRVLPLYIICQALAVALCGIRWDTPFWHLWYLLSLCFWLLSVPLFERWRWPVLVLSVAAGCLAGLIPWIGRSCSWSRTIVFFPYFWLGVLLPTDIPWHRFRIPGLIALGVVLIADPQMSVVTLYHAAPCDPVIRLQCYGYALLLGLFLLSWCPRRRFPWTRAGADTLPAYLLHAPIVAALRPVPHPVLATILLLYIIHKAMQWRSIHGIIGKEEDKWPDLKIYTKPRASRSTASSCP